MPVPRQDRPTKAFLLRWKGLGEERNCWPSCWHSHLSLITIALEEVILLLGKRETLFASRTFPVLGFLPDLEQDTMATTWLAKTSKLLHATCSEAMLEESERIDSLQFSHISVIFEIHSAIRCLALFVYKT